MTAKKAKNRPRAYAIIMGKKYPSCHLDGDLISGKAACVPSNREASSCRAQKATRKPGPMIENTIRHLDKIGRVQY